MLLYFSVLPHHRVGATVNKSRGKGADPLQWQTRFRTLFLPKSFPSELLPPILHTSEPFHSNTWFRILADEEEEEKVILNNLTSRQWSKKGKGMSFVTPAASEYIGKL
eukprot:Sspe_Gene.87555::Locus_59001_Transcript_1_1_Confidence_1.000_Length_428::g.87555::m.87555